VSAAGGSASSVAKQSSTRPKPAATTTAPARVSSSAPRTSDTISGSAVKSVPLIVLNNTTVQGLAAQAAQRFEAGGWTVRNFDNYSNDIASTCAYYDPSDPEAKPAAEALQAQFPAIRRVKEKFSELPAGPVVVVLTPDYTEG
jgi:LytR cell envelope-related transcriptional attenuator